MNKIIEFDGIKCEMVDKGNSVGNSNMFEAISDAPLSKDDQKNLQSAMGYSPYGYGHSSGTSRLQDDGKYLTKFSCQGSCD